MAKGKMPVKAFGFIEKAVNNIYAEYSHEIKVIWIEMNSYTLAEGEG